MSTEGEALRRRAGGAERRLAAGRLVTGRSALLYGLLILTGNMMGYSSPPAAPVAGKLQVTYLVSSDDASRFTAVWLENERGDLLKTLFVSSELAQGAFTVEGDICPDWIRKSHWEKATQAEVDAVSGPTPTAGSGSLSFDLEKHGIVPGLYFFCMQIHIHDNYNILYKGEVRLGEEPAEARIEVFYSPGRYDSAEDLLRDVKVRFTPETGTKPPEPAAKKP